MFKCYCCGKIFEYPICVSESRGEFWGMPAFEDMYYSPCCVDDFEEVHCDENGIVEEVEIEEEVEDYLEYVTYTRDWYYENCSGKCEGCKFYKDNKCMWEV